MKFIIYLVSTLLLCLSHLSNQAQQRTAISINNEWRFHKGDVVDPSNEKEWEKISIPHTWNAVDITDDVPGYYRGIGWYKKTVFLPHTYVDKEVYLYFEGVGQVAEVFVNGKSVGKHIGSYTRFQFPISDLVKLAPEGNTPVAILVKVDNSHDENIPPLSADFTFYGGIYRDVYLVAQNKLHFGSANFASNGVFISTPKVSAAEATVRIRATVTNKNKTSGTLNINHAILDSAGQIIASKAQRLHLSIGETKDLEVIFDRIKAPELWSVDRPYLYSVVSTITDTKTNVVVDEIANPLGFRWFHFDAKTGFQLNGKSMKLIGASRHQDYKGLGNALPDRLQVRDVELLKEMGGNFLRIAHYPQDPVILAACDRLGILTSVETPVVNRITESEAFATNAKQMHLEMIRQNYNHPSLIIWAYMNEVLLKLRYDKDSEAQKTYLKKVAVLAQELEDLTRKEDPDRYTMIPNHGAFELYHQAGLTTIPKLTGWNLYYGWYFPDLNGFASFLDLHHQTIPNQPLLVTEYGADADERLHTFNPIRFDKSLEYATIYHEAYLKAINDRPFVAAAMIWNLADFNAESRAETMPHINNKGVLTWDRQPKDAYRFYQANLLRVPFVKIGAEKWRNRIGISDDGMELSATQPIQVFTNSDTVKLMLNGKDLAKASAHHGIATFQVPFMNGKNRLVATITKNGASTIDYMEINFELVSQNLKSTILPFKELRISLGEQRFFYDAVNEQNWIPEQAYHVGSWGYLGGKVFTLEKNTRITYGSDKDILSTDLDPLYATQRTGIEKFKFDVAAGTYAIELHLAELLSKESKQELIYNLGGSAAKEIFMERVFDVSVNGIEVLKNISNKEALLPEHAYSTKFEVTVKRDEGITLDFIPKQGTTILNAIKLTKIR